MQEAPTPSACICIAVSLMTAEQKAGGAPTFAWTPSGLCCILCALSVTLTLLSSARMMFKQTLISVWENQQQHWNTYVISQESHPGSIVHCSQRAQTRTQHFLRSDLKVSAIPLHDVPVQDQLHACHSFGVPCQYWPSNVAGGLCR